MLQEKFPLLKSSGNEIIAKRKTAYNNGLHQLLGLRLRFCLRGKYSDIFNSIIQINFVDLFWPVPAAATECKPWTLSKFFRHTMKTTFQNIIIIVLLAFSFLLLSFQQSKKDKLLNVVWNLSKFNISMPDDMSFVAEKKFKENYGYRFLENKKLLVKQSNGKCMVGETKINYEIGEGKWSRVSDTILNLSYKFRGAETNEKWLIVSLTEEELKIRKIRH